MNEAAMEQLEESLRGHESLSEVDDFNGLTKKFIEHGETIKSLQGNLEGKIAIPGENSSDEERNTFYTKTGRPESPEKYEFEAVEQPEGRVRDEVLENTIRKVAHDKGVSASQLKALHKAVSDHGISQHNEVQKLIKEQTEKDTNALKDIWKGDSFKENVEKSERTFKAIIEKIEIPESLGGKQGMIDEFKVLGFLDESNPKLRYFMASMFKLIGDDTFIEGMGSSGTPKELEKSESGVTMLKFPSMEKK